MTILVDDQTVPGFTTHMTNRIAHTIVPGDTINGKVVFDMIRPALRGGFYIPFEDGSRLEVAANDTVIGCD